MRSKSQNVLDPSAGYFAPDMDRDEQNLFSALKLEKIASVFADSSFGADHFCGKF